MHHKSQCDHLISGSYQLQQKFHCTCHKGHIIFDDQCGPFGVVPIYDKCGFFGVVPIYDKRGFFGVLPEQMLLKKLSHMHHKQKAYN